MFHLTFRVFIFYKVYEYHTPWTFGLLINNDLLHAFLYIAQGALSHSWILRISQICLASCDTAWRLLKLISGSSRNSSDPPGLLILF